MTILAIESSAVSAGCAVSSDSRILSSGFVNVGLTHSQTLMPLISDTLRGSGLSLNDIDFIAVSAGPGSFTGGRIGVCTAKGIAFTEQKPCVAVSTLEAIAQNMTGFGGWCCPVMDARRGQVYNAMFSLDGGLERMMDDRAVAVDELAAEISAMNGIVWLCGDGAELCWERMKESVPNVRLAPVQLRFQNGCGVALAAERIAAAGGAVHSSRLVPVYLRLPQAERELRAKDSDGVGG